MLEQTVATRIQVHVSVLKTTSMGIRCRLLVDQWNVECKALVLLYLMFLLCLNYFM